MRAEARAFAINTASLQQAQGPHKRMSDYINKWRTQITPTTFRYPYNGGRKKD